MMLLTITSVVLSSAALCFIFYQQISALVRGEIREMAERFRDMSFEQAAPALSAIRPDDMRISVIDPDGTVLYDNTVSAGSLENHASRPEIRGALESGAGEGKRFSGTLEEETFYYAVKLPGGPILRTAKTTGSIFFLFGRALPLVFFVVLGIIIIGYAAAGRLTNRIVKPINKVSFDGELVSPYDELAPFIRAIAKQREQIALQLADLQKRTETINAIMENMSEGAVLVGPQGTILSANKSAMRTFDADTSMEGKNILELLRDVTLLHHTRCALAGRHGEMDMEKSGRNYHVYFSPVTDKGAILLFLDTTEKTEAEKLRREFSANISHELATPLTSISGYAEMIDTGMAAESDKPVFIKKIKEEAARLITLINDIMVLSRMDEGKTDEPFEEVDLASVAAKTIEALGKKAAEQQVSVVRSGKTVFLKANPSMMAELFYNLIDNAIKYNKPRGVVRVETGGEEGRAWISVSDTGIGIPREAQERIFERFYRVDKSRSRKTGGTGLGLAIVKHIVLLHHGEIHLESREEEGTRVGISFGGGPDGGGQPAAGPAASKP
jgi:two-component system phosphate regulon sensor histidine kinase PhoR